MAKKQTTQTKTEAKDAPVIMVGHIQLGAFYEVLEGRNLFFTHTDRPSIWANAGDVVQADNQFLAEMMDKQYAKITKVDEPEDKSRLVSITRNDVLAVMAGRYFRPIDAAKVSIKTESTIAPEVD